MLLVVIGEAPLAHALQVLEQVLQGDDGGGGENLNVRGVPDALHLPGGQEGQDALAYAGAVHGVPAAHVGPHVHQVLKGLEFIEVHHLVAAALHQMDSLPGAVGQLLQVVLGNRKQVQNRGNPFGNLEQAQGQPVFTAVAVLPGIAPVGQGADQTVGRADVEMGGLGQVGKGHALGNGGEHFQNVQNPVNGLHGMLFISHRNGPFRNMKSLLKTYHGTRRFGNLFLRIF